MVIYKQFLVFFYEKNLQLFIIRKSTRTSLARREVFPARRNKRTPSRDVGDAYRERVR